MKIPNAMSKDRNARSQNKRQVFTKNTTVESRHSTRSTQNLHENRDHKDGRSQKHCCPFYFSLTASLRSLLRFAGFASLRARARVMLSLSLSLVLPRSVFRCSCCAILIMTIQSNKSIFIKCFIFG